MMQILYANDMYMALYLATCNMPQPFLLQTTLRRHVTSLDVCEKAAFRVAAVNQYGTKGFSEKVARTGRSMIRMALVVPV